MITFKLDGYGFGERALEGVMFDVTVDTDTRTVTEIKLAGNTAWEDDPYLAGLNKNHWLGLGLEEAREQVAWAFADIDQGEVEIFEDLLNSDGTLEI